MNDLIQAEYERLEAIPGRFGTRGEAAQQLRHAVQRQSQRLRVTWEGEGAAVFNTEMERIVLPAMQRLIQALSAAAATTRQIAVSLREAEEQAAALFRGRGEFDGNNGNEMPTPILLSTILPPTDSGSPDPTDAIARAARDGDWATVNELLSALPPEQRAEIAFRLGYVLDIQTLRAMYADPTYGTENIHMLLDGMAVYVGEHDTQENRDVLAEVAYNTTHAGLIDERGDTDLAQAIIERVQQDPAYGQQIADYLNRYASWPPDLTGTLHEVVYQDGQLIHRWRSGVVHDVSGGVFPRWREEPISQAILQSLYSNTSYSGGDLYMADNPVHVDEYAFTITNPQVPPGVDPKQFIYEQILAQMGQAHGGRVVIGGAQVTIPPLASTFNFPGIDGMPQRGDALPLTLPDPGFVVVSQGFPVLRIRTVTFPGVDSHPLNGAREWGVEQIGPDTYRVYTRGAARDDTDIGAIARTQGLERTFWRHLMGDVAGSLTPTGETPPPVSDWSFGASLPVQPGTVQK